MKLSGELLLESHKLSKELLRIGADTLERIEPASIPGPILRLKAKRSMTRPERYSWNVQETAFEIASCLDQLDIARSSLAGFSSKSGGFSRIDYVTYHKENYIIRVQMLRDRALRFVNAVFDLGMQPKSCTWTSVVDNHHLLGTGARQALKQLDKTIQPIIADRNIIVHQATHRRKDITMIRAAELTGIASPAQVRKLINLLVSIWKDECTETSKMMLNNIEALWDQCFAEHQHRFEVLHSRRRGGDGG